MGKRNAAKRMKHGSEVNLNAWFEEGARGKGPKLQAIEGGRGWHPDDSDTRADHQRAENGRTQKYQKTVKPRTENQAELMKAMDEKALVAALGPAGTGKTYLAICKAVEALQARGAAQATTFPKDHRPWGWFESLVTGPRFQVKRILVHPGASLSLQSHFHRSEHWIVVEGTARVTRDDETRLVTENESIYLPLGCRHRMENPGKVPMVLIEVQTGTYVGEDDIIRYEDVYARGQGARG